MGTKRPKILQIGREELKPGKGAAHVKNEMGWPAAYRKAGSKSATLAITSASEAWFLSPYESFAALEAQTKADESDAVLSAEVDRLWAVDGELLSRTTSMTAMLRESLGYRADWDVAKMRYYQVTVTRVQPGYGREFEQVRQLVNAAHEKVKIDERWAVYQVMSGAPSQTYVILQPMASLAELDKGEANHGKEYQDALGEDGRERLREFNRNAVRSTVNELMAFSPKMSYLPKEFMDRDPEFWNPKPAAPAKKN